MATPTRNLKNLAENEKVHVPLAVTNFTHYIPMNPHKVTAIHVFKNAQAVKVEGTIDHRKFGTDATATKLSAAANGMSDGVVLDDLEDSDVRWFTLSDSTTDYFKGDSRALAGLRISALGIAADVDYAVIQL